MLKAWNSFPMEVIIDAMINGSPGSLPTQDDVVNSSLVVNKNLEMALVRSGGDAGEKVLKRRLVIHCPVMAEVMHCLNPKYDVPKDYANKQIKEQTGEPRSRRTAKKSGRRHGN